MFPGSQRMAVFADNLSKKREGIPDKIYSFRIFPMRFLGIVCHMVDVVVLFKLGIGFVNDFGRA